MRRVLTAIILTMALLLSSVAGASYTSADTERSKEYESQELKLVGRNLQREALPKRVKEALEMYEAKGKYQSGQLSLVKGITDLAGNEYVLVEYNPTGYAIIEGETGILMEYTYSAESPYHDAEGEMIYLGPTFYYERCGEDRIVSLFTGDIIKVDKDLERNLAALHDSLVEEFLKSNRSNNNVPVTEYDTYVTNYDFFINMDEASEMGYYCPPGSDGVCGYIALAILLAYYQKHRCPSSIIDAQYRNTTTGYFNGSGFTQLLRSYGSSDDLTHFAVKSIADTYLGTRNVSWDCVAPLFSITSDFYTRVDENRASILMGSIHYDPDASGFNHAVVVYGYSGGGHLIAHFGWPDYTHVYVYPKFFMLFNVYFRYML